MARVIVHAHRRADSYIRFRRAIAEDPRLTWKAKMLIAYLLDRGSHPNGWQTTVDELSALGADREFAVRGGLDEAEKAGYLRREVIGVSGGGRRIVWHVTDEPADENAVSATNRGDENAVSATSSRENHASHLLIQDSTSPRQSARAKPEKSPRQHRANEDAAHRLTDELWDRSPRPAQPYIAIAKVIEAVLDAGHATERVRLALGEAPVVSIKALEFALNRPNGRPKPKPPASKEVLALYNGMDPDEL